jgi:LemA protein
LVEVVKDYMSFEQETLQNVTKARNVAMAASGQGVAAQAQAEAGLTRALQGLYVVMENYPDLKANQNVAQLQEELTSTENKVAYSRQFYNDSAMRLNTAVQRIPANIVAGIGGFKDAEFFEVAEAEKAAPKVDLR